MEQVKSNIFKAMWRALGMGMRCGSGFIVGKIILELVSSVAPIISAWYFSKILNSLTSTGGLDFTNDIVPFILLYGLVEIIQPFAATAAGYSSRLLDTRLEHYRYIMLAEKRASLDIQKVEDPKFSDLFQKANDNSWRIYSFIINVVDLIKEIVFFIVLIFVMLRFEWWISATIIVSVVPLIYVEFKYGKNMWEIWEENSTKRRIMNNFNSYFKETSGLSEIKIFRLKNIFIHYIGDLWKWFCFEAEKLETTRLNFTFLAMIVSQGAVIAIFFLLTKRTFLGLIEIGTFTFILSNMMNLRSTTGATFRTISDMQMNYRFVRDTFLFLDAEKNLINGELALPRTTPTIKFNNVNFAYPGTSRTILHDINITIEPGTKMAIVGVNGAGKTTFTKLLLRIYDPTSGTVYLDSHDLKDVEIESYYSIVGLLSQEYAKYKVITKDIIGFGDTTTSPDMERVIAASKQSGAHDFIMEWKDGYDTQLGKEFENGVEPSIGQWQKLALARMFYKNPQIWILDEPTASIDALAEMQIFDQLHNLPKDKTVILISHRFNTVKNADKIIVIEDGTIQEEGSHDELMKQNGRYAELFNLQKGSYE